MSVVLINPFLTGGPTLLSQIVAAGLPTPKICLDAGDIGSFPGSGTSWNDVSGNANNFTLLTSTDPLFNGAPGEGSANDYWSFPSGSGSFSLTAGSNPAFAETLHKANAAFTIATAIWPDTSQSNQSICGTEALNNGSIGFRFGYDNAALQLIVGNGSGTSLSRTGVSNLNNAAWNICAVSENEAGGLNNLILFHNGTASLSNATYASPSSSAASAKLGIAARGGNGIGAIATGNRIAWLAIWDSALSSANLTSLYNATKTRFGL